MTREELKKELHYSLQFDTLKPNLFIDKIYDYFENRSCYECKNWCQEFQSIGICDKGIKEEKHFIESMTYHNFYCNKWENKA